MKYLCFLAILFSGSFAFSGTWWSVELRTGSAKSFSTGLDIEQTGFPKIHFDADYETRPFEDSPYYGYRISRCSEKHAWEIEFLHHKIYLKNTQPDVSHFEVTHGYNMLFLNHAWVFGSTYVRAGAGAVISHAESEIRNQPFNADYDLSGFVGQGSVEKRFYFSRLFFLTIEGKFTAATASVSVAGGKAHAPNIAVHALAGLGFDFGKRQ